MAFHSFATCSGGNSICNVETESGCFSTSTFMKESDLTPRAFVGQPLPVAGVLDGRRHACPTIQITRCARTKTSRTHFPSSRGPQPRDLAFAHSPHKFVEVRPSARSFAVFAAQDDSAGRGERVIND